jgi:hypothetical protein
MRRQRQLTPYELGMYAAPFLTKGNLDAARVGFGRLGCGSGCGCEDCSSGLGRLGVVAPGTTVTGSVVSVGVAAGTALAATAGASAGALALGVSIGSAAGPIGTVVGAVVGYLTSKLFGNADYANIYSQVSNSITLAQAYAQVAGKYPGRVYGWLEMQYIWSGLVHWGIFPQNYNGGGVLGSNPGLGVCTEASISHNINACGTQSWINDVVQGTGTKAIQPQIENANKNGVYNPQQVWSNWIEPVWNGPVECSGCVDWFLPQNARSGYASLVEQLVIDTVDAIEFNDNACLANYYGSIPAGWTCSCASGCSGVAAPAPAAAAAPSAAPKATTGAATTVRASTPALAQVASGCSPASVSGASIVPGDGLTLCDTSGNLWSFGTSTCNSTTCQGTEILLNGASSGGFASELALIDGQVVAQSELQTAAWNGSAWVPLSTACVSAPSGYTQIGTDTSGNPVYENTNGVLYECSGSVMAMFSGDLDLSSGVEPAQQLQSLIQGNIAAGQSVELATQNALASIQSTGTEITPDIASDVQYQVTQTAASPVTVPVTTTGTVGGLSTTELLVGVGVLAGVGALIWWAMSQ